MRQDLVRTNRCARSFGSSTFLHLLMQATAFDHPRLTSHPLAHKDRSVCKGINTLIFPTTSSSKSTTNTSSSVLLHIHNLKTTAPSSEKFSTHISIKMA